VRDHALAVDVQVACDASWVPQEKDIVTWVRRAFDAARADSDGATEVSVRVVAADEMQMLNREYRQRDTATNVLSFPSGEIDGLPAEVMRCLGDIVVCADVVNDEAAAQGKSRDAHWSHMLVHGTLHLLGYDHQDDAEAAIMESLETRVLQRHGVNDPYGESC
jgi:probable rRNA maturation factor